MALYLFIVAFLAIFSLTICELETNHKIVLEDMDILIQQQQQPPLNQESRKRQMQQSQETDRQFSIEFEFVNTTFTDQPDIQKFIQDSIQIAVEFFRKIIVPINPTLDTFIIPQSSKCYFQNASVNIQTIPSDFHILVAVVSTEENWVAQTRTCMIQQIDSRPILGMISLNDSHFQKLDIKSDFDFQSYVDVIIHEIFHAIAFSPSLFSKYIDLNTNSPYPTYMYNTQLTPFLKFPKVLQWTRNHFNCSSINSVPLENQGSNGSFGAHWEKDIFINEIMTASLIIGDHAWSGLNNAVLQDSGWYFLNQNVSKSQLEDRMRWGEGKGCEFFYKACNSSSSNFQEFCSISGQILNSFSQEGAGKCKLSDLFTSCGRVSLLTSQLCNRSENKANDTNKLTFYGFPSKSFKSTLSEKNAPQTSSPFACHNFTCDLNKLTINLTSDISIKCDQDGQILSNFHPLVTGQLECPSNITQFCDQSRDTCQGTCGRSGFCLAGQCNCLNSSIIGLNKFTCECEEGYYLQDNQCVTNGISNCASIDSNFHCVKCHSQYYLLSTGECAPCTLGCEECQDVTGQCNICELGSNIVNSLRGLECLYYLNEGIIIQTVAFILFITFLT